MRVCLLSCLALCCTIAGGETVANCYVKGAQLASQPVINVEGITTTGTVSLELELTRDGRVVRALNSNGLPVLREAAVKSLPGWRFAPGQKLPPTVWAYVYFTEEQTGFPPGPPAPPPPPYGAKLSAVDVTRVPNELRDEVLKVVGLRSGQVLKENDLGRASAAVRKVDARLQVVLTTDGRGARKVIIQMTR